MRLPLSLTALLLLPLVIASSSLKSKRDFNKYEYYVLEHDHTRGVSLDEIVSSLGLEVIEAAGELQHHWLLRGPKYHAVRYPSPNSLTRRERQVFSSIRYFERQSLRQRTKRAPPPQRPPSNPNSLSAATATRLGILDPEFPKQWHLVNDDFPEHMVNATPVWEMGITGKGVTAAIIDDGLDYESDDLATNFDAENSYDYNEHVPLPKPLLSDDHHGTRCAGQIAAVKNDVCGVGIAYDAKVAGIRILSGPISDVDEAAALNYGFQNSAIYSCSWGPPDDGRSMEGPGYLIQKAVLNGIQNGRGRKGSIFVFASGNGAAQGDQCNFDGYTNSIYSVTVAAVDFKGLHPYYSEACAANMVVSYSSGSGKHIVTTDIGKNKCSHTHGGTSAAAPNAVGVFTLALSARPELSWRDIQHLCVHTAKMINPEDPDWEVTAAGRNFSYKYGYGVLDAHAFVTASMDWELVKPQAWLEVGPVQLGSGTMSPTGVMAGGEHLDAEGVTNILTVTAESLQDNNFEKLEHVDVKVWISHTFRGDVEVELVSPNGVKSVLAGKRKFDRSNQGFQGWNFMTVKHWDENPVGDWTIRVSDQGREDHHGHFLGWSLLLWGSTIDASSAKPYELPIPDQAFPAPPPGSEEIAESSSIDTMESATPTSTKFFPKPTAHLPGDHGNVEGEASKPAFSTAPMSTTATSTTSTQGPAGSAIASAAPESTESLIPTPDEGWFSDMSKLVSSTKWIFGVIGVVAAFGLGIGIFLWRRRFVSASRGLYAAVRGDDVPMGSMDRSGRVGGGNRTKELYDAFGELSDDGADEETGLRAGMHGSSTALFDEEAEGESMPLYRDEPGRSRESLDQDRLGSPGSGSGDRSWIHASESDS